MKERRTFIGWLGFVRETRDFNQVKCIKDEREHLLVKEDEI